MSALKLFRVSRHSLSQLTANEKKLLPILIKAAKEVDKIFLLQENRVNNGANLYPRDAIKQEILNAAEKNPKILSPYTLVKRDKNRKLYAVDYHIEYKPIIEKIIKLLNLAIKICENKSFKSYLDTLSQGIASGEYEKINKAWLLVRNSNIDLILGPYERYLDRLFFIKRAYQASVGIIDLDLTAKAKIIRDILYSTTGRYSTRVVPPSIVDMRVEHTPILSGFVSRALFSRQHLPADTIATEKYGSIILGYLSSVEYKFEKLIFPVFESIFETSFKKSYSKELLRVGNYYYVLLTAIAQQLHRYRNSKTRLKEIFPIFDEANSVASGIQHAKHLVLKGVMDQKQLEATMICLICWAFAECVFHKQSNIREDYLKGDSLIFNFLLRKGALQEKGGISWPNFAKMFFEMENLATIFVKILEEGNYLEGQEFLDKYLSFDPFIAFKDRLAAIEPI